MMSTIDPTEFQKLAYRTLNEFFNAHEDETIEIEVLPAALQPPDGLVMSEDLSIGIPKKVLVAAYLEARQMFFAGLTGGSDPSLSFQATRVILLFDPEHITAANYRKRRLAALKVGEYSNMGSAYHQALRKELYFLNSILTSPLHRQSKSPTLWYHRLLLIKSLKPLDFQNTTAEERLAFWRAEFMAVCKAGEQHPKNYYAWQYARRLISISENGIDDHELSMIIKDWCYKHPSDISGWSFLWHVCSALDPDLRDDLLRDVLSYAINMKAEQESLWVFIRMALAYDTSSSTHAELCQTLRQYSKSWTIAEQGSTLERRVINALQCFKNNRK